MRFDDPKHVLESAAASPSRPLDAQALVRQGARLRRARFAAAAAGLAVAVGGASASFGLLGAGRGEGPGPAAPLDCSGEELTVSIYLHEYASEGAVAAFERELRENPDVVTVEHVSEKEALEELASTLSPETIPASLRVRVVDTTALGEIFRTTLPVVQGVVPGGRLACVARTVCDGGPAPTVSIYLRDDASPSEVRALRTGLRRSGDVAGLEYVSKAEAYREFQELYADRPGLSETVPRDSLPASFRVETSDAPAVERLALGSSRAVADVVHGGELRHRLCRTEASPEPNEANEAQQPVPPPVLGPSFGEHANDILVTMDRGQCDATPSWPGAPPSQPGQTWCRFEVSILNLSDEELEFDVGQQVLQTMAPTHIYRPEPGDLFQGRVPPGETGGGWLVYRLLEGEEPEFLTLSAPGYGSAGGRTGAFGCREILAAESGVCSYSSKSEIPRLRYVQSVELYHCGVVPFSFGEERWVSDPPPFDATNAPADFTGTGTIELVTYRKAIYTDSSGAEIQLRADEEWEPPPCA
jgi:hypothetical protein